MKVHIHLIIISIITLISSFILYFLLFRKNVEDIGLRVLLVILFIWISFFPTAFYTCYRLIVLDDNKGRFLGSIITCIHGGLFGGVFFVPFIVAPIFIFDYIKFVKEDYRKYKYNKETQNNN